MEALKLKYLNEWGNRFPATDSYHLQVFKDAKLNYLFLVFSNIERDSKNGCCYY